MVAAKRHRFPADYRDHAGTMHKMAETYPDTMVWGTDTPAHYFIGRFINDKGKVLWMRLMCGPETEAIHTAPTTSAGASACVTVTKFVAHAPRPFER